MSSGESDSETLLPDIAYKNGVPIPVKSKERYMAVYESFEMWRKCNSIGNNSEDIILRYFKEMAKKYAPSTLWAMFSMVKWGLKCNNDMSVENYPQVTAFLRALSMGYKTKKVKGLCIEHVEKFIDEAPDDKYLATKVALIFGINGGLGRQELCEVTTSDVENHGELFLVHKPNTKNTLRSSFIIEGNYYNIVKKYQSLRTDKSTSNRFFQQFREGKCRAQVIGINRFGMMPKEIAEFLNLPDAHLYTGHSFRSMSRNPYEVRVREKPDWWARGLVNDSDSSTRIQPELPRVPQERKTQDLNRASKIPDCTPTRTYQEPKVQEQNRGTPTRARQEHSIQEQRATPMRGHREHKSQETRDPQCRFCGDFKECSSVLQKPYLIGNKVSLALNHLRVELDFSIDSLPKTVCRECDAKLMETFEFIKQVNAAQFSLVAVTENTSAVNANNMVHTYTSNDFEINTHIVKAEFESDEDALDSLPLSETVYLKEAHKRKKKHADKSHKKKKKNKHEAQTQHDTLIIDIKEEIVDLDTNDESSVDLNDTGTDIKPSEEELAESEFIYMEGHNVDSERDAEEKQMSSDSQCND